MQTLVIRCVDDKPGFMFGDVTHMLDARGKNVSISKSVALDPVPGSSKQVSSSNVMTVATIPSLNVFLNCQTVLDLSTAFLGYSKEENLGQYSSNLQLFGTNKEYVITMNFLFFLQSLVDWSVQKRAKTLTYFDRSN